MRYIANGNFFNLPADTKYLFIGHSLPQHALNDKLINNSYNLSKDGRNNFYAKYQLNKVLNDNPQINYIFIDVSNNIFYQDYNQNIYKKTHMPTKYPNVAFLISLKDQLYLLTKNPLVYIASVYQSFLVNTKFILTKNQSYLSWDYKGYNWGEYFYNEDELNLRSFLDNFQPNPVFESKTISRQSIALLNELIEISKKYDKGIYLIRTPIHSHNEMLANEEGFIDLINNQYNNYHFLDFVKFPLRDDQFRNIGHLNYKGAEKFSTFFNQLLEEGKLEQKYIDEYIENHQL